MTSARGPVRSTSASSRRTSCVATRDTSVTLILSEGLRHPIDVEAVVEDRADAADRRAGENREAGDVMER